MIEWGSTLRPAIAYAIAEPDDHRLSGALGSHFDRPNDDDEQQRLRALVELAQQGDADAFGQLYDHYVNSIFRFVRARVGSTQLAEDITGEAFLRALRSINTFTWQGKDFGAWLTTIARNLITDHYKSRRTQLEIVTDVPPERETGRPGPDEDALATISNEALLRAVNSLPADQRDCILMRFIQELSIAETAQVLGKSEGAVKQLQLRGVRRLAKAVSEEAVTPP
ncbi:MAG: sigma-70 family RNA polymerase sigma factor [Aeromicrobium sp.]